MSKVTNASTAPAQAASESLAVAPDNRSSRLSPNGLAREERAERDDPSCDGAVDPFQDAVAIVLAHEGGYQAMQDDPGNWTGGKIGAGALKGTKYGISAAQYPALDIAALTPADAAAIYRRDYWDRWGFAQLPPAIAAKLFDAAVNLGVEKAVRALQRALRAAGKPLMDDGNLGAATIAAAGSLAPEIVLPALREALAGQYRLIAERNVAQARFLAGWLSRAYS